MANQRPMVLGIDSPMFLRSVLYSGGTDGATQLTAGDGTLLTGSSGFDIIVVVASTPWVAFNWHFGSNAGDKCVVVLPSGIPLRVDPSTLYGISASGKAAHATRNPIGISLYQSVLTTCGQIVTPSPTN